MASNFLLDEVALRKCWSVEMEISYRNMLNLTIFWRITSDKIQSITLEL